MAEKEELEPARVSENEPFKKQTRVAQKVREKGFKKEGVATCVEGSREASDISSGFGNYHIMNLARAGSVAPCPRYKATSKDSHCVWPTVSPGDWREDGE